MSELSRQHFRLMHRLRVRWGEVDIQRIVFNPHYLAYIDSAFTEYWRALAIPYESIPQLLGGDIYVKKSTLEFHGSALLDDLLDVGQKCERVGTSSMLFRSGIFRGDALLVSAELVYVFADSATQTSKPVPSILRELLQAYEKGVSPVEIRMGPWSELGEQASALRQAVFMDEFRIPLGLAYDAADDESVHALVSSRLGQVLATGRLTREGPGLSRIARVAVNRAIRSTGFGRTVVQALVQLAAERGDTRVVLSSQCSAQGFYARLGFIAIGEPYIEAEVPHVDMAHVLPAANTPRVLPEN